MIYFNKKDLIANYKYSIINDDDRKYIEWLRLRDTPKKHKSAFIRLVKDIKQNKEKMENLYLAYDNCTDAYDRGILSKSDIELIEDLFLNCLDDLEKK